jgi:hypothetical protein
MTKFLANPFFVYILSFSLVLSVYTLGWSLLYPVLSAEVVIFFLLSFIVSFVAGIFVQLCGRIEYQPVQLSDRMGSYVLFVWLGYLAEFAYNGGVPFLQFISGGSKDYTQFGIPTFHVFLVTFGSFLSVHIFHQLISDFKSKALFYFLISLIPCILIINRGMLVIILASCLFVYLLSLSRVSVRAVVSVAFAVLIVFYLFGKLGNLRQTNGKTTDSDYILVVSKATDSFKNSLVPSEFIWAYLYISSPLANLEHTIDEGHVIDSWISLLNYDLLPDFISKRTGTLFNLYKSDVPRVADWLTVSTIYARPFVYVGWLGIIFMFWFFIVTTFLYIFFLPRHSRYYVTGLALLCAIPLFNTFDNMYSFTGLNLQLAYPLILSYVKFPSLRLGLKHLLPARNQTNT